MVVLNYMALHGPGASSAFQTLYPGAGNPGPNLNNTLGDAKTIEQWIAYQPLASLVNGKVPS
jgi:hypothetical protein